jgi:uncharacterized membrane protein HdeD (DUF308 family)
MSEAVRFFLVFGGVLYLFGAVPLMWLAYRKKSFDKRAPWVFLVAMLLATESGIAVLSEAWAGKLILMAIFGAFFGTVGLATFPVYRWAARLRDRFIHPRR